MRSRRPLRKVARTFTSWMRLALPSACSRESEEEPLQEQRRFPVMYPFARPSQLTTKSAGQQLHDWTSQSVYDEGRSSPFVLEQMGVTQVTTPSLLTKQGLCNILRSLISGPVSRSKYRSGFRAPPPPPEAGTQFTATSACAPSTGTRPVTPSTENSGEGFGRDGARRFESRRALCQWLRATVVFCC